MNAIAENNFNEVCHQKVSLPFISETPDILANIYEASCNIVVWKRTLCQSFLAQIASDIHQNPLVNSVLSVSADSIEKDIEKIAFDKAYGKQLREYIAQDIDMFCVLFDAKEVGLRLSTLDRAMCPRFHVDHVPCRFITTFYGVGTQWLPHEKVNREKLGHGSKGLADDISGLYSGQQDIQQLNCGDVALLKGELWDDNEGAGLVHRSPALGANEKRLVMTLDLV